MGFWGRLFGRESVASVGGSIRNVAEVFIPNATQKSQHDHEAFTASLEQFGGEFQMRGEGQFHSFVNGVNRLPRPFLALGTLGLFVYAMVDPVGFSARMQGISLIPDPLWWLLGAIVSFYFGARELHYVRRKKQAAKKTKGTFKRSISGFTPSDQPSTQTRDQWAEGK